MDTNILDLKLNTLVQKLGKAQSKLNSLESANRRYKLLELKYNEYADIQQKQNLHLLRLNNILVSAKDRDAEYKKVRLAYMESSLEDHLAVLFPEENAVPRLVPNVVRGNKIVDLVIYDRFNKPHTPGLFAGGMMKSLITFGASLCVANLLGSSIIFIDEAFGAGSEEKKIEMGNLINKYISNGTQMIVISQSDSLYRDIPSRVISLEKDPCTMAVNVVKVEDNIGGNQNEI